MPPARLPIDPTRYYHVPQEQQCVAPFPNPAGVATKIDGIQYLGLPALLELKLSSGLTGGVARLKNFADVVALIQTLHLPLDFSHPLNPYVRPRDEELWNGRQAP